MISTFDKILDDMGQETFSFEQGTDYSGNLLSNDNETYYFDSECELVGGGNPSVPPTPPPPLLKLMKLLKLDKL